VRRRRRKKRRESGREEELRCNTFELSNTTNRQNFHLVEYAKRVKDAHILSSSLRLAEAICLPAGI
jgi:hypothetical protein